MRKFSAAILVLFAISMLWVSTCFAFYEKGEMMDDNAKLDFHTLAIGQTYYNPSDYSKQQHKLDAKYQLLTPEVIRDLALKVGQEDKLPFVVVANPNEADAYVVFTISNDSKVSVFADIYSTKDKKWLYSYQVINGNSNNDNLDNYKYLFHKFYRNLDITMHPKKK